MNTDFILELVGYFASLLVLISLLMTSAVKLRIINMIGSLIFAVYAVCIKSYPTAVMNFCLVGVNIYFLYKLTRKTDRHYALVESSVSDGYLTYFLEHYKEDIKKCFPDAKTQFAEDVYVFFVCCDAKPVGVLIGSVDADGVMDIRLDYSIPEYRDCSVGAYLYEKLAAKGVTALVFRGDDSNHKSYLSKMNFEKAGDRYVKSLS